MGFLRTGIDFAGGTIIPDISAPNVLCNGFPIAVLGSGVIPHGSHKTPHGHYQRMITSMNRGVFIGGRPVCRTGDIAGCGHPGIPGSPTVGH
tara:strand:- start:1436 stop:1711 length:276 start_codon:yes stop_codon:yes gene_type:complete